MSEIWKKDLCQSVQRSRLWKPALDLHLMVPEGVVTHSRQKTGRGAEKKTVEKGGHRTSLHRGNLSEEAQLSCKDADLVVETLRRRNSKIAD